MPHLNLEKLRTAQSQGRLADEATLQGGSSGAPEILRAYLGPDADLAPYQAAIEHQRQREIIVAELDLPPGLHVYGAFGQPLDTSVPEDALVVDHDPSIAQAFEAAHTYVALPYALTEDALGPLRLVLSPEWER